MIDGRKPKPTPRRGRPRVVELIPEAAESLARRMLAANVGRDRISASMAAWKHAMEEDPALLEVLRSRSSKHSLPVAVREVARRVHGWPEPHAIHAPSATLASSPAACASAPTEAACSPGKWSV